jgi:uncharacterized protein
MDAESIIRTLGMRPHTEGGHFVETFRDIPSPGVGARARSSAIYFLLREGERSVWHRVDATEIWLWHAGAPLTLTMAPKNGVSETVTLGPDLAAGQRPQVVVPAFAWQTTSATTGWALTTCVVAPGFEFSGFELAPPGWTP